MNPLQWLRDHPMALAAGLVAAFGYWLVSDASSGPREFQPPTSDPVVLSRIAPEAEAPPPVVTSNRDPFRPGVVTPELITRLQPGMARVEVEELIGMPPAGLVHPVSNVDGRFVYRASYLANLDPKRESIIPTPRSIIAIEFDAGRPGHPLVKVHVPDPMS